VSDLQDDGLFPGVSQVERVVATLAAHGRVVSSETVERQLGGFGGLPSDLAADALLRTYCIAPDGTPLPGFEPDRTSRGVIAAVLLQSRTSLVYVFVAVVVGLVPAIAVPLLMRLFVDRYIVDLDTSWGLIVILGLLVAGTIAAAAVVIQSAVFRHLQKRLFRSRSTAFVWHSLTMSIPHLQHYGVGNVLGRFNSAERFAMRGGYYLPFAFVNSLMAIVFLGMIFFLDALMGFTALVVSVVTLVIGQAVLKRRESLQRRFDTDLVHLSGYTSDVISSIESIKAAAGEQFSFARWAHVRQDVAASATQLGIANQYITLVPVLAQTVGLGALLAIGVSEVFAGTINLGTVVAAQAFMVLLLTRIQMLATFGALAQTITSAEKQFGPVVRQPLDPELLTVFTAPPTGPSAASSRLQGAVSLHSVNFGYGDATDLLLEDLSLEIEAGRRIALVGPSGSGKTTIAKLIIGELRPWSGYVSLDGTPRLSVPRDIRTRDIAYVPQTSVLFPGTIRDNLTLWDEGITDDAVERAARDACIEDTILSRPGAYFHDVTAADGGFSGGELQRLAIARALARDPDLLILDEATSALDPLVEVDVIRALRSRGCTCLLVAHRLSTVRDADRIVVLERGSIVQQGSFDELIESGRFAELAHG
jgi:ABC-type bacteriocin/lantibiotic exporter with double-glycine peptidase domain